MRLHFFFFFLLGYEVFLSQLLLDELLLHIRILSHPIIVLCNMLEISVLTSVFSFELSQTGGVDGWSNVVFVEPLLCSFHINLFKYFKFLS